MKFYYTWLWLPVLLIFLLRSSAANAQITLDGTMGVAGALTGPNFTIPAAVGQTRGSNLFHSFGLFNVQTNQSATFTGPNSIGNIFGRVTGGQPSTIDGTIRSTIPNANLYLMNPAGMLFGPNAFLDVQGSFHATTADYLKFADGAKFHADLSRQSTLTTAPVSAFGFLSQSPASIDIVQNSLQVSNGKTLSVVAGDINVIGDPAFNSIANPTLAARGGRIQIGSVGAPGEVPTTVENLDLAGFERLGDVNIFNSAYLYASGNGGGTIVIRGGRLLVENSFLLANNLSALGGASPGIDIGVRGNAIVAGSLVAADSFDAGPARDVRIRAGELQIENSVIASSPFASGNGGAVTISATDTIALDGAGTSINTINQPGSSGNGGNILLAAESITVNGGAQIASATLGSGNSGNVQVIAAESISLDGTGVLGSSGIFASSEPGSTGAAGAIFVGAKNLTVTGGAVIRSGTFGPGNGGSLTVQVADTVILAGVSSNGASNSGITAQANPGSTGAAGDIMLDAKNLIVTDGAAISSATFGPGDGGKLQLIATETVQLDGPGSLITASSEPGSSGRAGDIFVAAKNVTLTGGAQISSVAFGTGRGGSLRVTAGETVRLDGVSLDDRASSISANSEGSGSAGNVVVDAENVALTGGGQIVSATFASGKGGTVQVTARQTISLDGAITTASGAFASSGIAASNQPGSSGDAGDVLVNATNLIVTDGAEVSSRTFGSGSGGTVRVSASDSMRLDGFNLGPSAISANAESGSSGNAGNIFVDTKRLTLTGGAQILGTTLSSGNGGTVQVTASDSITLAGVFGGSPTGIIVNAEPGSTGNAGNIVVATKNLSITGGAQIASGTFGSGDGGTIRVTASEEMNFDGRSTFASGISASSAPGSTGDAGDLVVQTGSLTLTSLAQIASGTFGLGDGGTVQVIASENIKLDSGSSILASTQPGTTGNAGDVQVSAANLLVTEGAAIGTGTAGSGNGGTVDVSASDSIALSSRGRISSNSAATGPGGSIDVRAPQISLSAGASISAVSTATGNAGNIFIQSDTFRATESGVTTAAVTADGGNIHLKVGKLVELVNSQITTSVQGGAGAGGNITIDPQFVILNNSQITANAFGGPGGKVTIIADNFLATPDSAVTASSALSTPGTVDIQAPITDLIGSLAPLPESIVQASSLLRQSCATRYGSGKLSSLASPGRGGMPFEPGGYMASAPYRLDTETAHEGNGLTEERLAANLSPTFAQRFSIYSPCSQ